MKKWLLIVAFVLSVLVAPFTNASANTQENDPLSNEEAILPLAKAHAHNDYEHTRPLLDALDHGFTSVEADVWLVDGELLVAHDEEDLRPERTLQSLYLDPLMERVKLNQGSVYPNYEHDFILWIDIKSEGEDTYQAIHDQLRKYQKMLTKFTPSGVKPGAITVYISGNRPRTLMENQRVRYAAYDGRMSDLGTAFQMNLCLLLVIIGLNILHGTVQGKCLKQNGNNSIQWLKLRMLMVKRFAFGQHLIPLLLSVWPFGMNF